MASKSIKICIWDFKEVVSSEIHYRNVIGNDVQIKHLAITYKSSKSHYLMAFTGNRTNPNPTQIGSTSFFFSSDHSRKHLWLWSSHFNIFGKNFKTEVISGSEINFLYFWFPVFVVW